MMPTFDERKNNYISFILTEYAPPEKTEIKKILSLQGYEFVAIENYKPEYKLKKDLKEELFIKPTLGKYVILITLVLFILIASIKLADSWYLNLLVFVGMALVLNTLFYIKIGKAVVIINSESIFIKENADIRLTDIIMVYFKTYYSEGERQVHSIILHHHDKKSDIFKATEINLSGLSASPEEIACYIEIFYK